MFHAPSAAAQTATPATTPNSQPASATDAPDLDSVIADLQRITADANRDLGALHIEKWKSDNAQRQQMQQAAGSLRRNLSTIMPGPAKELQNSPRSVSRAFKLYHNLNLVYEFLNSLTDAAGALGRPEEYTPLAKDLSSLDEVRHNLSAYTEQIAGTLEADLQDAKAQEAKLEARAEAAAQASAMRKEIDAPAPANTKKKKTVKKPAPAQTPAPTAPPQ
jgi:chromosome segregation ATPase